MATARDEAIRLFNEFVGNVTGDFGDPARGHKDAAAVVDAIIEAARAPESAHTRAVAERQRKVASPLEQIGKNPDVDPRD